MEGLELLRAVREQIIEHPEEHNQRHWGAETDCGTTYCVAGWALALNDHPMEWTPRGGEGTIIAYAAEGGTDVATIARRLLSLSFEEAYGMFFAGEAEALRLLDAAIERREAEAHQSGQ